MCARACVHTCVHVCMCVRVCACVCTRVLLRACSSPVTLWITNRTCYTARAHYQVVVTHVCARVHARVCSLVPAPALSRCGLRVGPVIQHAHTARLLSHMCVHVYVRVCTCVRVCAVCTCVPVCARVCSLVPAPALSRCGLQVGPVIQHAHTARLLSHMRNSAAFKVPTLIWAVEPRE